MDGLAWLEQSFVAVALTRWMSLYVVVNAAHILSIGLLLGAVLPLDLRILGLFPKVPLSVIGPLLSATALTGAVCAILTGGALFTVRASEYAANPAFQIKLCLIALGLANALLLHCGPGWRRALQNNAASPMVRISAALSLATWPGALLSGRWIGFL